MTNHSEIHKVCLNGDMKRFNILIKETNFRINIRDNLKFTPLMCACFGGNIKMVKKLLDIDNILINARSRNGKTALIIAATRGYTDIVKYLIKKGANPNIIQFKNSRKSCKPKTALDMSLQCNHKKITKLLKGKKTKKVGIYKYWSV